MTDPQFDLIALLRHAVCGAPLPEGFAVSDPQGLFRLAHTHDLAHIVCRVLQDHGLLDFESAVGRRFAYDHMLALWRTGVQERELREVSAALSEAGIDHIPLKGSVLRARYPEPWMRTSSDTDLLVREGDLARAEQTLTETLGFTLWHEGEHDHTLCSPSGMHLELHFVLTEHEDPAAALLRTVWDSAEPVRDGARAYRMTDAMFWLYHVYHAASHMRSGTCGVRPVLDTWVLNHRTDHDPAARRALLERAGLQRFADALQAVSEAWFSLAPLDQRYLDAESFLLTCGVYRGDHMIAAAQARFGGRGGYLLHRVFPPRSSLRRSYPVLDRRPWLLPACWAHRIAKALVSGKTADARRELHTAEDNRALSRTLSELFDELGLL